MRLRLVFDLDGTLVDSAASLTAAANALLAELGRGGLPRATVTGFVGDGTDRLVERVLGASGGVPAGGPGPHQARFREIFAADPVSDVTVYPQARETLSVLASAGHGLAVCTQKPVLPARRLLEALGLMPPVTGLTAGDSLPVLKPDRRLVTHAADQIGTGPVVFIGDSEVDAETARNADVPFLLHRCGYPRIPLDAIPRAGEFSRFGELPALLARISHEDTP